MNGAEGIVRTLLAGGVDHCFTNPGTSEMYFVQALDSIPEMRCILCLQENVATGAADGYGRMADRPAATLLHLGPGLANGWSNLHNAARAFSPIVNLIGEHATYHRTFDAPLHSDIAGLAERVSRWVRSSDSVESVCRDAAEAIAAARAAPGGVATQIVPLDVSWSEGATPVDAASPLSAPAPSADAVERAAEAIRSGGPTLLLLTGAALRAGPLETAARIAASHPCVEIMAQTSNGRIERGAGRAPVERIPYPVAPALARLERFRNAILVGAKDPVAFFAYPGRPSRLLPAEAQVHRLAEIGDDLPAALSALADALAAQAPAVLAPAEPPPAAHGPLTAETLASLLAEGLPADAVVVEESVSVGRGFFAATETAAPHDWLQVTGGAIGNGPPMAVGAAMACPGRRVICLEGDGSALYTHQALWTMAREGLDVTTVVLNNGGYAILHGEFRALAGEAAGPRASRIMDVREPAIDWPSLAAGFGVPATRAADADAFRAAFARANATPGPHLIEAVVSGG
ncbi:MAG: acetolactate synthase large subunit [Alphaproteobacteria bacterium]|nr:acetolactate synthase large subunit [Alphaproteobacteria bacterium]